MDVAIALPNAVPGTSGAQLAEWARRAEDRGFSSLAANDRVAYGGVDASFDRAARLGAGWIAGGVRADEFAKGAARVIRRRCEPS